MDKLNLLANKIKEWNDLGREIATIIRRPAQPGHIAEYIAAEIFDIRLMESASHKGIDGYFCSGPLADSSVNIKWTAKHDRLLNITFSNPPDYYLVLTGPKSPPVSSRGQFRPWVINYVYIFENHSLIKNLRDRGIKIGVATSVIQRLWNDAEIFPSQNNAFYTISENQIEQLLLFQENDGT